MRNLKKVLSLVLAMAMMLSIMVVGAGAAKAFTDAKSIENATAVEFCSALGIINGYEDGSFKPEGTISRAEMTKMMAIAMTGKEPPVVDNGKSSFVDVLDSNAKWANKYIEFCYAAKIVAGVGENKYNPDGDVMPTQAAKMLLVVLGNDPVENGYLGSRWEHNVNVDAAAAGLFKGLEDIALDAALTRDDAAQMIWNALKAERVGDKVTTLLADKFGAGTAEGIMTKIDYNQDTGVYTYWLGNMKDRHDHYSFDGDKYYRTTADYTDLFAQKIEVLTKGEKALSIRPVYENAVVVSDVWGNVSAIDNTHFNTVKISGQKYRLDNVAKDWPGIFDESNMVAYNDYANNFFTGLNWEPAFKNIDGDGEPKFNEKGDPRLSLAYGDKDDIAGEFEQYSFVGIDQDGGGDIDIFVVYPYAILKTEAVRADDFVAREIVNRDASMTVHEWEQDRYMICGLLNDGLNGTYDFKNLENHYMRWFNGSMKATIEFDDIQTVGTIQAYDYVKVTPGVFTAECIDRYEDVAVQSAVANKLTAADLTVTLGDGTYDGELLEQLDAFRQIALKKTYSFVEENGYLFMVDGNALVPELSQFVVVTKVANHTTPNAKVDNIFVTEVLTTNGDTMNVEVAGTINYWGHHGNLMDYFVQTGHMTDCPYCDDCGKPVIGSLYYIQPNDEGTYYLAAVPCFSTAANWTSIFDFSQAYIDGATLNSIGRELPNPWANPWFGPKTIHANNHGLPGMIDTTPAGVAFKNIFNDDYFAVEDEAPIFVYNKNLNTYSVVKGSDLDKGNISGWAFTGATFKTPTITTEKRIATVDLGYVMVENNPVEETVMAYVDGKAVRGTNEEGKYVIMVDVITKDGVKTLTTDASVMQNNLKFQRLYNALNEGGYFELIVDGDTLVDIKHDNVTTNGTVVAINDKDGVYQIVLKNGKTVYFNDDSVYVQIGAYDSVANIQPEDEIEYIDSDKDDVIDYLFF